MNDELNTTENSPENSDVTSNESNAPSQPEIANDTEAIKDDYYEVDHSKKDVISTIGDGEMHNEGLVGAGEATTDIQSSMERLTDEQDVAESHDSEQ